jgi:hypothetical protein
MVLHNHLAQVGCRDLPLPHALSPGQILQTMVEIGVDQHVLKLAALTSRDLTNRHPAAALPAIMVNQVHGSPSDSEDEEDDEAPPTNDVLSSEDSINLLVYLLQGRLCYHCKASDHVIRNCPTTSEQIKSNFIKKTRPFRMRPKA